MGWIAGMKSKAASETAGTDESGTQVKSSRKKRGIILILVGLVVTGFAAGYKWLKKLPK